jgi:predicted alternative tryptophan synthase beta-subunit
VIFGPCGGGSSFGGIAFPFLADKAAGDKRAANLRCVAVEPTSCPTLTKGAYAYDYGDVSGYTPIMRMYTLGHDFMPPGIHAGGLRYHGDSPLVSQLLHEGRIEALAVPQVATFEAGVQFARAEGIIPAPESCHAIRAAIDEALALQGDRRGEDHPLQPDRPRPFRHGLVRPLFLGQARGLRLSGRSHRRVAEAFAEGGLSP